LEAESLSYPTDSCTFPTEEIIDAQKFNFVPEFPQSGVFQPQILYGRKFFDRLKLEGANCPWPPCHDVTECNMRLCS